MMSFNTIYFQLVLLLSFISTINTGYIPPGPLYRCPTELNKIQSLHPCTCDQSSDIGLYVTCENSGIATLSVGLNNLATLNSPIELLTLRELNIYNLYGPLFYKLNVRVLRIENTPLSRINEDAFLGVNNTLQDLHIENSNLESFPKEAFQILGNLTILKLNKHKIKALDKDIFTNSLAAGKLERVHVTNGQLAELQVESFQVLRKLKTLDIHGNSLTALKRNQFKGLRDVETLDISYNNITKLESSHIGDLTKLSWCNVSHNHLTEMTRGMFARNTVLRVLHMDHNKLKKLDTNSFRGMRFLRRLYMSDNEISDVGRGTFSGITRIGTIDLARNKIKKVDYQMFYKLNLIEIIDLAENQITEVQKAAFTDIYLSNINISHNALHKIEAGSFENCANITILDLSHNYLSDIQPKAFDATTYATEFRLSFNNFTVLNQIPIQNMTGIKILNVSHNAIESIPRNTFPKLYELHTVDISHNKLKDIFSSVFQTLFSLRILDISHNEMVQIKPATFGTLPTLLHLDLSYNSLKDVSRGALSNLASCRKMDVSHNALERIFSLPISLGEIDLSYNNISSVPANIWPTMNSLLKLDLSHNPLGDSLTTESFSGLLSLQTLVLTSTSISRPPWEALSKLSSLQYLKLDDNNITELNKGAFGRLPIVFDLDLSNNRITNVAQRSFEGLLQLLSLSLRNNSLTFIPNEAFRGLVSLRSLDLSYNLLEKLDNKTNGLLDDCLSLNSVNLSHNKIGFLTKKTFPNDPYIPYRLKNVDLSYNIIPVITKELAVGTKYVEVLNISNNMINDIRRGVIGNLTSLRVLDLSHNQMNDLSSDKEIFRLPANITDINLSDNNLLKLPIENVIDAKNLSYLDLRNNAFEYFDKSLVTKINENNFTVYFSGNPLQCDCFTRPLKHYLNHLPKSRLLNNNPYSDIICSGPSSLENVPFVDVDDDRLNCIENVAVRTKLEEDKKDVYAVESDIAYRNVIFSQETIYLQWYVQTVRDVAGFRIVFRDSNNEVYFTEILPYNRRDHAIKIRNQRELKRAIDAGKQRLEVCILGGNTETKGFNFFQTQCRSLPGDFRSLPRDVTLKMKVSAVRQSVTFSSSSAVRNSMQYLCVLCLFYFVI